MRNYDEKLKNTYKCYAELGKQLTSYVTCQSGNFIYKEHWKLITEEGLWTHVIPHHNGNIDWLFCFAAVKGLASTYHDIALYSVIVSQFSAIYLLIRYGSDIHKDRYLHRLIQGEVGSVLIPKSIVKSSNPGNDLSDTVALDISAIVILAIYTNYDNKNIKFFIFDNKTKKSTSLQNHEEDENSVLLHSTLKKTALNDKKTLIHSDDGLMALRDFLNFKRILYANLSSEIASSYISRHLNNITCGLSFNNDQVIKNQYEEISNAIHGYQKILKNLVLYKKYLN